MSTSKLQCATAYEDAHAISSMLLDELRYALHDLPAPESDDAPVDWGHVGTVREVNRRLSEIIEFLSRHE